MSLPPQQRMRLSGGTELSYVTAGDPSKPALLLLHGFPSSARTFRHVIPGLACTAYVIAPDLPGHGQSDVLPSPSFAAFGDAISEVLDQLAVGPRYIYLHDLGAPVGLRIAMEAPELVSGLVIQNANAHRTCFGPQWEQTLAYWSQPNQENEAAATAHLTVEGTRDQYVAGVPAEVSARIAHRVLDEPRQPGQQPRHRKTGHDADNDPNVDKLIVREVHGFRGPATVAQFGLGNMKPAGNMQPGHLLAY